MVGKSEGSKPTPQETGQPLITRRAILRRGATGAAGLAGAALLGQVGIKGAEAGGGPVEFQSFDLPKTLTEKHPELEGLTARLLEVEGSQIKDDLAQGPKVYKIHAPNGLRLETRIRQDDDPNLEQNSFVRSKLYSEGGVQVSDDADTFIEKGIFETGDYYLVVNTDPKTNRSNYGVTIEARNRYDHDIQMTLLRNPSKPWAEEWRSEPDDVPLIRDKTMGVVMTVHRDSGFLDREDLPELVRVYSKPDTGDNVGPENDEKNLLRNYKVDSQKVLDGNGKTKAIRLVIASTQGNDASWIPDGSLLYVGIKNWGGYTFATTPFQETPPAPHFPPPAPYQTPIPPGDRV